MLRRTVALAAVVAVAGCGSARSAAHQPPSASPSPPTSVVPAPDDPASGDAVPAPAPAPVAARQVPAAVAAAVRALPPAPGLEVPVVLPAAPGGTRAVSAEATSLGGTASVTLVATATPHSVNDPGLSAGSGTPIGTFSTTPTASAATATEQVRGIAGASLDACTGPSSPVDAGRTPATACATALGPAIGFRTGSWQVQVVDETAGDLPTAAASAIGTFVAAHPLPQAQAGVVTAAVTGAEVAVAATWAQGADVYATRSGLGPTAALELAEAMRPLH